MASELELKAVVSDAAALRRSLEVAGARRTFRGMLRDRRLDNAGRLTAQDQVLRLRRWVGEDGAEQAEVGWKGPVSVSPEGYKRREELSFSVADATAAIRVFERLGFNVVHAIDRFVEVYHLAGAVARIEWYPRMDLLIEIEGPPDGIERLIAAAGLPRNDCSADNLAAFVVRYQARTGRRAVLAEAELEGEPATWNAA